MKNILKSTLLLMAGVCLFTACDDDLDNNPTLQTPSSFVLNTPAYSTANIDLATSDSLAFSWSQPDYGGFPAAAQYQIQVSPSNTWTVSTDEADADETGATTPTYATMTTIFTKVSGNILASELATALQKIQKFESGVSIPAEQVYARCMAVYAGDTTYSNAVTFTVLPYYVELADAAPIIYYLTGGCIGNGGWGNAADAVGVSMVPLLPVPGTTFDKRTGAGQIEWYGYLPDNAEFKIICTIGDWDHGICGDGGTTGGTSIRNGGDDPGNIKVADGGYYHIVVNTSDDITKTTTTIEKMDNQSPSVYSTMSFLGDFNSWDLTSLMTAMNTNDNNSAYNHDWVTDITLDADGGVKFTANGNWDVNWGAADFPYGTGTNNGDNIPAKAGKYKVFLNDISGSYYFFEQE